MSNTSQGEGWWLASDGKWYPPEPALVSSHQTSSLSETGTTKAYFRKSQYLGGLPGTKAVDGNLHVTDDGIGIGITAANKGIVIWSDMASVSFDSAVATKSKVGATVMFGVLGALASKGTQDTATISVNLKDGNVAFYRVLGKTAPMVRAGFQPFLNSHGIVCLDDNFPASQPLAATHAADPIPRVPSASRIGVADELLKLSTLRDQGVLSEEEFADMKQGLLAQSSSASDLTSDANPANETTVGEDGGRGASRSVLPPPPAKIKWREHARQDLEAQKSDGVNPLARTVPSPFGPKARKERKERKAEEKAKKERGE